MDDCLHFYHHAAPCTAKPEIYLFLEKKLKITDCYFIDLLQGRYIWCFNRKNIFKYITFYGGIIEFISAAANAKRLRKADYKLNYDLDSIKRDGLKIHANYPSFKKLTGEINDYKY